MITAVPAETPITVPEVDKETNATGGMLLLQVPPGIASDNVVAVLAHSYNTPLIGDGKGSTVITVVAIQLSGEV